MLTRDKRPTTDDIQILRPSRERPENEVGRTTRSPESQSWQWLYKTKRYRQRRKIFMTKNPFCVKCGKIATDLDHIKAHKGNQELFFDEANWQALCGVCHRRKTVTEDM